jgi:hypothetical protein
MALVDIPIEKMTESTHPYPNNNDTMTKIDFPEFRSDANELNKKHIIKLKFSPESRTERGCDYIQFFTNEERSSNSELCAPISGRYSALSESADLIIPPGCSTIYLWFKTDGSTNYWGYHLTISCVLSKEMPIIKSSWCLDFKKCLGILDVMSVVPMMKSIDPPTLLNPLATEETITTTAAISDSLKKDSRNNNETKQNESKQNETKQNETKQNETKQNETKQNETKQNEKSDDSNKTNDIMKRILSDPLLRFGLLPTSNPNISKKNTTIKNGNRIKVE